jgi:hypothetical protein
MKAYSSKILLFLSALLSCKDNNVNSDKIELIKSVNEIDLTLKKIDSLQDKSNRIIINYFDNDLQSSKDNLSYAPFNSEYIYQTTENDKIYKFNELLKRTKRDGYCCCPERNYTISYYLNTNLIREFYIDTIEYKDKIVIFNGGYQYSHLVDKNEWLNFLKSIDLISYNDYYITNLDKAREVYEYTIKNNLPIINSRRALKEWYNYNGSFWFKVSDVENRIDPTKIEENIRNKYPNSKFKIIESSDYIKSGDKNSDGIYNEKIFEIYCDFSFYKNFGLYSPKSYYDEATAEFKVLGKRQELDKIDKIQKKEDR